MEIAVVAIFFICIFILQLFVRKEADNYTERLVEMREDLDQRELKIDDFTAFESQSQVKVELLQGDPKVVIMSMHEIIDNVEISQDNGKLKIYDKNEDMRMDSELRSASVIKVYYNELNEIRASRNSSIQHDEDVDTRSLKLETQGNSRLVINVDSEKVEAESGGNSTLIIRGEADTVYISSNGNSTLAANDCYVRVAQAESNGNSTMRCQSDLEINAHASGNSSLSVFGDPKIRKTSSSGNASIRD